MKSLRNILLEVAACGLLAILAVAQNQDTAPPAGTAQVAPVSLIRISAPKSGEKLTTDYVQIQYQLTNPAASAATPYFQVQLDGGDPVVTTANDYTFTGLTPGQHSIMVVLVDANGTPIAGARSEVRFTVVQPKPPRGARLRPGAALPREPRLVEASFVPDPTELPNSSSALPLLSIVGFGALMGGIASALKTKARR